MADAPAVGVDIGASTIAGDGEAISATGSVDGAKRGDMSQPPTATLATTSAIRIRRGARFTRMGDASCRPHHSATRSPVPSADDPARRRCHVAPLDRPDGRRPDGLGTAGSSVRSGRVRGRNARPAGHCPARADARRQVDRAGRDAPARRRAADLEGVGRAAVVVLVAVADDPVYRRLGRLGRASGGSHRPDRAGRSTTELGRSLAADPALARWRPRLVGGDRGDRGIRGRPVQRLRRECPGRRSGRSAGSRRRPAVGEPAALDRRTQGDRADRIAVARHHRAAAASDIRGPGPRRGRRWGERGAAGTPTSDGRAARPAGEGASGCQWRSRRAGRADARRRNRIR